MNKKVLVTGATGFTGSHLAEELISQGYQVRALARPKKDTRNLEKMGIEIAPGNLTEKDSLAAAVAGIDTVYHIAAVYREQNVPHQYFFDVNVGGTKNLLEAARDARVRRFVHCSTVGVQGEIKNPPAKETAPYGPGDYYQQSKLEGEKLALEFFKQNPIEGVVFRPVGIYGPGDTRFLKIFKFVNSGSFRMIGRGNVLYHMTFVKDLARGIILCGERKEAVGEIFTLGGNEYVPLSKLIQLTAEALGVPVPTKKMPLWPVWTASVICEALCYPLRISPPLYRRRLDFFVKDRAFDISKAKKMLGYNPQVDLATGLKITGDWYKANKLL